MHHAVELCPFLFGFLDAVTDHDEGAGQDLQMLGIAADLFHAVLDVGVKLLSIGERAAAGEHGFSRLGRELPAVLGRAGLHDQRPALDGAGDVERPAHGEVFSLVIEHVHLRGIEIEALFDIAHKGVVGKGIPETGDHVIELARPLVALGVLHMVVEPEIERSVRIGRGHDIPSRTASADMVERGEAPGDMIGLVERRRSRRDQPDVLGGAGQRRQQRERLERRHGVAALERIDRHVQHGQMIGHEEGIEFPGLQFPDQTLDMRKIEISVRPRAGIAPRPRMNADRPHKSAQPQLTFCHW